MSDNPVDMRDGSTIGAKMLLARAAAAEARALDGLMIAIDDFFLPEDMRLDERTRAALSALLRRLIETAEAEVRDPAVRLLVGRGEGRMAEALAAVAPVHARLVRSGVLRDPELMAETMARVRQELLGAALPTHAPDDPERPSLINRFIQHPDRVVAAGAMAVMIAESRRRGSPETGQFAQTELPAELHHRLVWWVAAALRDGVAADEADPLDFALVEAAQRSLAAYDESERLEAAAMRFAAAIDAHRQELPQLLVESLGDRRLVLFTALLARALGISYPQARELVIDSAGDRLWLGLRSLDLPRDVIARIGYALSEADGRRDIEGFADTIDTIAAIGAEEARRALAPMKLQSDYRAARLALARPGGDA